MCEHITRLAPRPALTLVFALARILAFSRLAFSRHYLTGQLNKSDMHDMLGYEVGDDNAYRTMDNSPAKPQGRITPGTKPDKRPSMVSKEISHVLLVHDRPFTATIK